MLDVGAIAPETGLLIGGEWRSVDESASVLQVETPSTGEVVGQVAAGGAVEIDEAVKAARCASEGEWGALAAAERGRVLIRIGQRVAQAADELAWLGNPTAARGDRLVSVNGFVLGLLGHRADSADVLAAAARHPEVCILNVCAGMLWMLAETRKGPRWAAAPYLTQAERTAADAATRERRRLDPPRAWMGRRYRRDAGDRGDGRRRQHDELGLEAEAAGKRIRATLAKHPTVRSAA